jgi:predicted membrane chloride channel (bestrophin family)
MGLIRKIRRSRFHLLLTVVPLTLLVVLLKILFHRLGWEPIPRDLFPFFPSVLTGIIFLLGFLLAGVATDYKESEKLPTGIVTALFALGQEAEIAVKNHDSSAAKGVLSKLLRFVPMLQREFFLERSRTLLHLVESLTDDIAAMDAEKIPPNFMIRIRNEQASLYRVLNRINAIKTTDFAPSVLATIKLIIGFFLIMYFLLPVEPWWGGVILIGFLAFVLFSVLYVIEDMEDPFEYDESEAGSDEISLAPLLEFHEDAKRRWAKVIGANEA